MTKVKLAPEIEDFVNSQVDHGVAASADDYVNNVLRAQKDEEDELWAEIQIGIDDIEAGRFMSVEDAFASVREELGLKKSAGK
jgi:antitoxin ParD1/3/4